MAAIPHAILFDTGDSVELSEKHLSITFGTYPNNAIIQFPSFEEMVRFIELSYALVISAKQQRNKTKIN